MGEPRSVEEVLDAVEGAPTFGLNARELILQAARLIAQEDDARGGGASASAAQRAQETKEVLTAIFREGPALLQALPREQRPLVPFRAIHRSKVPRVTRQLVLDRLTGQHLALALHQAGVTVTPASLATLPEGAAAAAVTAAVAQEEELYERGKASKAVYLNFAARCNAGLWGQPAEPEPLPAAAAAAAAADRPAKRRRLPEQQGPPGALLEADIDWDNLPPAQPEDAAAAEAAGQPGSVAEAEAVRPAAEQQGGPAEQQQQQQQQQPQQQQQQRAAQKPAPSSSIARPPLRLQAAAAEPASISAAGQEEYSPSRHGGESPPAAGPAAAQGPVPSPGAAAAGVREAGSRQPAAQQPPGDPAVAAALVQFLRTHLEPLYQAKVVSRAVYKRALQQTVEKVMASHRTDADARFLVREGPRVTRLLQQLVEREQAREAAA